MAPKKTPKKAKASAARPAPAKATSTSTTAKRSPAKASAKKTSARKTPAKAAARKTTATKAPAKKVSARKAPVKSAGTSRAKVSARAVAAAPPAGKLLSELKVPAGPVDLGGFDSSATPGFSGGKAKGKEALAALGADISDWQERLYAEGRKGGNRSVLLVLQGMDTSGKGGVIRHGAGLMDPQGLRLTSFKAPTAAEKRGGFLARIRPAAPGPGYVGIFDRSHYEDVLIARVRNLVTASVWSRRYDQINDFEAELAANGTTIVKCFLHISADEQKDRLAARLGDPTKHWKFNPGDIDERELWPAYTEAYEAAIERCNTDAAPWYVIPSDRKWYRNWAVTTLLLETFKGLDPQWPVADFDVDDQLARLA